MTTLDNPANAVDESTVPFLPAALRYGLIGGLIMVVYALIANLFGFSIPTGIGGWLMQMLVVVGVIIGIAVFAVRHHRIAELGGYISFKRAFLTGFIALLVASVISSLFNILYMTVIDPGYADTAMEKMEELLANFGVPEDQMEKSLEGARQGFTPMGIFKNSIGFLVFNSILMLIVAAIMKKKPALT